MPLGVRWSHMYLHLFKHLETAYSHKSFITRVDVKSRMDFTLSCIKQYYFLISVHKTSQMFGTSPLPAFALGLWALLLLFHFWFTHFPPQAIRMCSEVWREKKLYPRSPIHSRPFTHTRRHAYTVKTKRGCYSCREHHAHADVINMRLKKKMLVRRAGPRAIMAAMSGPKFVNQLLWMTLTMLMSVKDGKVFMTVISLRPLYCLLLPFTFMTFRLSPRDQSQMMLIKTTPLDQMKTHILLQSNHLGDLLIMSNLKTTLAPS